MTPPDHDRPGPPDERGSRPHGWSTVRLTRALVAELLGTFVLTLASVGALLLARQGLLPEVAASSLTPGLVVLAMIYALGDVSGAHINPVVTLAFALRGAFPWRLVLPYWAAQFSASVLAALLLRAAATLPHGTERVSPAGATLLEIGCAGLLLVVVLATAHRNAKLRPAVGLAVGATVALDHFVSNPLSAVAMNPAKVFGPALLSGKLAEAWPHLLGPLVGALLGLGLTWLMRGGLNDSEQEAAEGSGGRG
ncbi:MIP/aquaporin family protein [Deinococcus hohokamensis]|uniref:MIP/aquaporin family protein n=1 Tax=Deinococcus hohokamensis TaxID=309883 RepID=A0ABV9IA63_9DEIO